MNVLIFPHLHIIYYLSLHYLSIEIVMFLYELNFLCKSQDLLTLHGCVAAFITQKKTVVRILRFVVV